jgi:hypothetical protein
MSDQWSPKSIYRSNRNYYTNLNIISFKQLMTETKENKIEKKCFDSAL